MSKGKTATPKTLEDCHEEGFEHYKNGGEVTDNPYDEEKLSQFHMAFELGFQKAENYDKFGLLT